MGTTAGNGLGRVVLVALALLASGAPLAAQSQAQRVVVPAAGQTPPTASPGTRQKTPQLPPLAVSRLEEGRRTSETEQALSLSFSEPVAVRELLLLLVRDTNLSVVPDPDVSGTFTGELKNVTMRQALELILQPLGLEFSLQGNILRVYRQKIQTRIYNINYVATRRSGSRGLSASSGVAGGDAGTGALVGGVVGAGGAGWVGPGTPGGGFGPAAFGGSSSSVSATDSGDMFEEMQAGMQTLLSPAGRFNLDRKAGLLQATDYPDRLEKVARYLEAVETRVQRQVQIQAKVVEVELSDEFSAGLNWEAVFRSAGDAVRVTQTLAPTTNSGAFTIGVRIRDFKGLVDAFASQGKVNVLSSPRVIAMNNEPAVMRVGIQDVFFVTTSQVDALTGQILQTVVTPQQITEGVVLSVTPQISAEGIIHLSITPSITDRVGQATSRLGDTVPIIAVRETDTLVRVHEGETVVIAGLMQDKVSTDKTKVPLLGDLPLVGGLFQKTQKSTRKTDLVIMLTPTVMTPGEIALDATRDQQRVHEETKAPIRK